MREIYDKLKEFGRVRLNEPLAKHITMRVGGPADCFVTEVGIESLPSVFRFLDGAGIPYFVLGGGSNVIASDEGFRGVVINLKSGQYKIEGESVVADAGCRMAEIAEASMKAGLTGFEWAVGVPGTLGGAVRGNAGAMGGEMKDNVESVVVYSDGEELEMGNSACKFGYRDSVFKHEVKIILRVRLRLRSTSDKSLMKKAFENLQYRNRTQPAGFSSGCIFKNVLVKNLNSNVDLQKIPAEFIDRGTISSGWLIEHSGMAGASVGGARVSDKHCNFILNSGAASAADILSLIEKIKEKVYTTFGISLEEEIQLIR